MGYRKCKLFLYTVFICFLGDVIISQFYIANNDHKSSSVIETKPFYRKYSKPYTRNQKIKEVGINDEKEVLKFNKSNIIEQEDIVHIALFVYGSSHFDAAIFLLNSILLFTKSHLHFYIFTFDDSARKFKDNVESLPSEVSQKIIVTQINLALSCNFTAMNKKFIDKKYRALEGFITKMCMFININSPDLRIYTDNVIFLDTDMILLDDILNLWNVFKEFNDTNVVAMGPAGGRYLQGYPKEHVYKHVGLNSGVVLFDLAKSDRERFLDTLLELLFSAKDELKIKDDQDIINMYFNKFPEQLLELSCTWNYLYAMYEESLCSKVSTTCFDAHFNGVQLLHSANDKLFARSLVMYVYFCMIGYNGSGRKENVQKIINCLVKSVDRYEKERRKLCHSNMMKDGFWTILINNIDKISAEES